MPPFIRTKSYEILLSEVSPYLILGLTATPERQDGHQPIIFMQAGSIVYKAEIQQSHPA